VRGSPDRAVIQCSRVAASKPQTRSSRIARPPKGRGAQFQYSAGIQHPETVERATRGLNRGRLQLNFATCPCLSTVEKRPRLSPKLRNCRARLLCGRNTGCNATISSKNLQPKFGFEGSRSTQGERIIPSLARSEEGGPVTDFPLTSPEVTL
jgi:hypothetical protein